MQSSFSSRGKRALFTVATVSFLALCSSNAMAGGASPDPDPPPSVSGPAGCNPTVQAAANRVAQAKAAVDRAAIDQMTTQPVSVLMATCNNQSAGVSATEGGSIFSGDFMAQVQPIVGSALNSFYDDFDNAIMGFFGSAIGGALGGGLGGAVASLLGGALGGTFGPSASTLEDTYDCEGVEQSWSAFAGKGIQEGIPKFVLSELLDGTIPSTAGDRFRESLEASAGKNVLTDAKAAVDALPKPDAPSFAGANSLCDVLGIIGITGSCP